MGELGTNFNKPSFKAANQIVADNYEPVKNLTEEIIEAKHNKEQQAPVPVTLRKYGSALAEIPQELSSQSETIIPNELRQYSNDDSSITQNSTLTSDSEATAQELSSILDEETLDNADLILHPPKEDDITLDENTTAAISAGLNYIKDAGTNSLNIAQQFINNSPLIAKESLSNMPKSFNTVTSTAAIGGIGILGINGLKDIVEAVGKVVTHKQNGVPAVINLFKGAAALGIASNTYKEVQSGSVKTKNLVQQLAGLGILNTIFSSGIGQGLLANGPFAGFGDVMNKVYTAIYGMQNNNPNVSQPPQSLPPTGLTGR